MGRTAVNIAWVQRKLSNLPDFAESGIAELIDAHNLVCLDITRRLQPSITRSEVALTLDKGAYPGGNYPLPTGGGGTLALLSIRVPDDWSDGITVVPDERTWTKIKEENPDVGGQPLWAFVQSELLYLWPIPQWVTADGVKIYLSVVLRPIERTTADYGSANPVFPRELDPAIRLGMLAQFTGDSTAYELELSKFNAGDYMQQVTPKLIDYSSRELGF